MYDDSVISYTLKCKNLSVRYGNNDPIDLYIKADQNFQDTGVPISILFYKRNKKLYLMLLSPNKQKSIDPQMLSSLVVDQ